MSSYTKTIKVSLIYLFFSLVVLRVLILTPGIIGHNWDWNVPASSVHLKNMFCSSFYTWNRASLGEPNSLRFSTQPAFTFLGGLSYLGLNASFISKFLPVLTILLSGISMFWLLENILKTNCNNENKQELDQIVFYPSYLGGFFYAFSPFFMFEFIGGAWLEYLSQACIPLVIILFRRANYSERSKFANLTLAALITSFISVSLHSLVFVYIILGLYSIYHPQRKSFLKNLVVLSVLYFFFSLWWIVPTVGQMKSAIGVAASKEVLHLANIKSGAPSLLEAISTTGYARTFFKQMLSSGLKPLWNIVTYGLVCFILFETLFRKKTKEGLFWVSIFSVSLIFATAGNPPLGGAVAWMYKNIFLMRFFRSPQVISIVPVLSLAILTGIASASFLRRNITVLSGPYKRYSFYAVTLVSLIIWFNPFFIQGDLGMYVLRDRHEGTDHIDIYNLSPGYKGVLSQINADEDDFRILFLPMVASPRYLKTEYQSAAHGTDPLVYYSPHPGVFSDIISDGFSREFIKLLHKSLIDRINGDNTFEIDKLLNFVNAKFLFLRRDVLPQYSYSRDKWNYWKVKKYLTNSGAFVSLEDADYVDLFYNKFFLPYIYPSTFKEQD